MLTDRRVARLFGLLVSLLFLVVGVASGTSVAEAENGVAAINPESPSAVGAAGDIAAGHVGWNTGLFDDGALGCCVAPSSSSVRHGPLNPGPLADDVARTFRSGSYNAVTSSNPTTLYRVYSDPARQLGPYWTRTRPTGPTQSVIDSALDPAWGNRATNWVEVNVPAGTTFYEGAAAAQGGLVGGGNQVFLPWVDDAWVVGSGGF